MQVEVIKFDNIFIKYLQMLDIICMVAITQFIGCVAY